MPDGALTYAYTAAPGAPLTRVVVNHTGKAERLEWDASNREWNRIFQGPRDPCDEYGKCGPFGLCDPEAASSGFCGGGAGFSAANTSALVVKDNADGCRRAAALDCAGGTTTDGGAATRTAENLYIEIKKNLSPIAVARIKAGHQNIFRPNLLQFGFSESHLSYHRENYATLRSFSLVNPGVLQPQVHSRWWGIANSQSRAGGTDEPDAIRCDASVREVRASG